MFKKLRNRLVIINITITTFVLFVAFVSIYTIMQTSSVRRPLPPNELNLSQSETRTMGERMHKDRQNTMNDLLWLLIIVGIVVEVAVVIISYGMAEVAIRPVREAYESQKTFIANASHEIKTPLAAISANLEAAEIKNNRWIDNTLEEVANLSRLNQGLLALVKADSDRDIASLIKSTAVTTVIQKVATSFAAQIATKQMKLDLKLNRKAAKIDLNAEDLRQVLTIFFDNAVKYGKREIIVSYQDCEITIENDGATIPQEKLAHIFERFYQVDKTTSGVGLGLAIAQTIAQKNNWELSVDSDKTTTFQLKLN